MAAHDVVPADYAAALEELKDRVRGMRFQAQRRVNASLIELYWSIGKTILVRQEHHGWGSRVIDRLAADLRAEFPHMTGLSRSNLYNMRAFAQAWPELKAEEIVQQPVGQLPWGHIVALLDGLDDTATRQWYAATAVEHGWSRNVLVNQIKNHSHRRIGAAPSNFRSQLEATDSELAQQLAKDPYVLDFLDLTAGVAERELEQALMDRLAETLRELGAGFAFVGRQVHFEVDGDDFYLDLLFFHVDQLRYVVVELKVGKFEPEFSGKLGFYVALVDDRLRRPAHAPTVGLLLCADRNETVVRYALSNTGHPMAVSTYTYESLPPQEQQSLPNAARIAQALELPEQGGAEKTMARQHQNPTPE